MEKQFETEIILKELELLLRKGNAHVSLNDAVKDIPLNDVGIKHENLPYSIWQLVEHIRITQKDILEFSLNENYKELNWPADYWPKNIAPENKGDWEESVRDINKDLDAFIELLKNADNIYAPFEHGSGQSLLREAMLIADHTSYHTGEILLLRRLLGNWKNS
jgi:hypothetical protein